MHFYSVLKNWLPDRILFILINRELISFRVVDLSVISHSEIDYLKVQYMPLQIPFFLMLIALLIVNIPLKTLKLIDPDIPKIHCFFGRSAQ